MGILGIVGKFAGGLNWVRIALIAALAAAIFSMGYLYSDKQHAEHQADVQKAITEAISVREKELRDEFAIRLTEEETARSELQSNFDVIRIHRDTLIAGVRNLQLTKPKPEIRVEACLESDNEDVQIVIANPFSESFRSVWNDAGSDPTRTDSDPGPETD